MRLLDAAVAGALLRAAFGSELLPRGFTAGGFTSCLLGSCHRCDELLFSFAEIVDLADAPAFYSIIQAQAYGVIKVQRLMIGWYLCMAASQWLHSLFANGGSLWLPLKMHCFVYYFKTKLSPFQAFILVLVYALNTLTRFTDLFVFVLFLM